MPKIAHVVGARPQFVKLSPVSRALKARGVEQFVVHTGQHFDDRMSGVFFSELEIDRPSYNLSVNSLPHGAMTGRMLERLEQVFQKEIPDSVLVYGDTNSTLAGALAAVKLRVHCGHVEAGLRSSNREMPEEHNRVVTDHLADLLFAPTTTAVANLKAEGLGDRALLVGDVMFDVVRFSMQKISKRRASAGFGLTPNQFFLATIHRASAKENKKTLESLVSSLERVACSHLPVVLPLHPGTRQALVRFGIHTDHVQLIEPISYLDMLALLRDCRAVITDSGGLQKEAYFAGKMCLTVREETEWVETVEVGANVICGADGRNLEDVVEFLSRAEAEATFYESFYGDGNAADTVVASILDYLDS